MAGIWLCRKGEKLLSLLLLLVLELLLLLLLGALSMTLLPPVFLCPVLCLASARLLAGLQLVEQPLVAVLVLVLLLTYSCRPLTSAAVSTCSSPGSFGCAFEPITSSPFLKAFLSANLQNSNRLPT
jgi:hypothetical protein